MGFLSVSPNEKLQKVSREKIKQAIILCSDLNLDFVTVHIEGKIPKLTYDELWSKYEEAILEYLDCAKDHGIILAIENLGQDLIYLVDLIKRNSNKYLMLTFDVGHAYPLIRITRFGNLSKVVEEVSDRIIDIHLHDHNLIRDHLPVGEGVIDFENLIKTLKRKKYKGAVNLEIEAKSIEDIIKSIETLRSFESKA